MEVFLNSIRVKCNILCNSIISNGTKEQRSRSCKRMNIRKGEELFTESVGKEITQSVKSRTEKTNNWSRSKVPNGKYSVLNFNYCIYS